MIKDPYAKNSLRTNIIFRFLLTYPVVFFTILALIGYILTSDTDEIKYNLRAFNLEVQNSIKTSFNNIERQMEFYGDLIGDDGDTTIFNYRVSDENIKMFFKALYVLDANSSLIYEKKFQNAQNISFDLPWLKKLQDRKYIMSEFMFEDRKLKTFFVAYEISDQAKIVAEVNADYIHTNLTNLLKTKDNVAFVIDYNGNYISGLYGGDGYNRDYFKNTSNVDELFVQNKEVIFHQIKMKTSLAEYMDEYNIFVVTNSLKNFVILFQAILIAITSASLIFYTIMTILNIKFTRNKVLYQLQQIIDLLKDKNKKPKRSELLEDYGIINDGIEKLYKSIEDKKNAIKEYKERFGYIFEKSPLILLVYDAYSGKIIDASNEALKFYGYSFEDITSLFITDISSINFGDGVFERKEYIEDANNKSIIHTTHKTKTGEIKKVISKSSMINLQDNRYIFVIVEDITSKKQTEDSNSVINDYFSEFSNVVLVANKNNEFDIKYATKNIESVFGISYDSVLKSGFDIRKIINDADKASFISELKLHKRLFTITENSKNSFQIVLKMINSKAQAEHFKIQVKFIRDSDGNFKDIIYYISDYKEYQLIQDKYETEQKQHKNIVWATDVATWEYNAQENVMKANVKFATMMGYENLNDFVIDNSRMKHNLVDSFIDFDDFFGRLETEKGIYIGDVRFYTIDKNVIWVHIHARAIAFDNDNNPTIISGIAENVTDKKLALVYQELASKLFSYSKESIIVFDAHWNIIDANLITTKTSGYSRDELLSSNVSLFNSKFNDESAYAEVFDSVNKFGRWHGKMWFKHKNGEDFLELLNITTLNDSDGKMVCYVAIMSDVSEAKSTQDYLEHIAYHDPLTKLPNRFLFHQKLEEAIRVPKNNKQVAIAYLDMDGFKAINDTYGHNAGDKFLTEISSKIDMLFDEKDMFARIGGDEFVAIILYEKPGQVYEIVENMLRIACSDVYYENIKLKISASIGVSMYGVDNQATPENLLEQADWAMYQAKLSGKNRYYVFDVKKDRHIKNQYEDNNKVLTALANHEFFMEYQPEIDITTNEIVSYEALIRWKKDGKVMYPNEFFSLIKQQNVIDDLAFFSLSSALKAQSEWEAKGINAGVCVNLSIEQICKDEFFNKFKEYIKANKKLNASALQIEIIDANSTPSLEYASKFLQKYRRFGIKFVLDDFASRTSSFEALELLPIDKIKVDKNICSYMFFNKKAFITVRMLKNLSDIFDKTATIKNLKDISTLRVLIGLGFKTFQGNFFEKPMTDDKIVGYKFKGIPGLNLNSTIDDEKFDELKDCIMLKEYAQAIITHIVNKDFTSDEDSFEGIKSEILTKLRRSNNHYKDISEHIVESLNTTDKTKALHLARTANIMCMKVLDLSQDKVN